MKLAEMFGAMIGGAIAFIGILILMCLLIAWPVSMLWNYCLVPAAPMLQEVTVWQMLGILFLCNMLTGGIFRLTKKDKS